MPLIFICSAMAAQDKYTRTRIGGTDYILMSEWSRAKQLRWNWIRKDSTLAVTNSNARVLLTANSREARVNNIEVWLLFPPVVRSGTCFISRLDAERTLEPLLISPRNAAGAKVQSICIDPGHGGKDPGNRVGSQYEKEYTLRLARELGDQLKRAGFTVIFTRTNDTFIGLSTRPAIATRRKADVLVSLHFNSVSSGQAAVKGAETYALTPGGARSTTAGGKGAFASWETGNRHDTKNMLLAFEIQKQLIRRLAAEDRGVKRARFQVLREASMPAVLVEAGFMSHPTESKKIFDVAYRREMARAITDGILTYKRNVEALN